MIFSNVCMKTQFNLPNFLYKAWYQGQLFGVEVHVSLSVVYFVVFVW